MAACPSCGTSNRDAARFCVRCGTTLGEGTDPGAASVPGAGETSTPSGPPTSIPAGPPTSIPAGPATSVPAGPATSVPAGPQTSVPGAPATSVPSGPPASAPPATAVGSVPPEPPATPAPKKTSRALIGVVVVALIAGLAGGYVLFSGQAEATNIFYEAPADAGSDPFTSPVDVSATEVGASIPTPDPASGGTLPQFGGSGSDMVCDREKLIGFLDDNADRKAAWAAVLGLEPDGVAEYIRGLRPATLTTDTRVTNHRFEGGRAVPVQSILPAGTAVLVDADGNPRVRCRCGNPLLEPRSVGRAVCQGCPQGYRAPAVGAKASFVEVVNPPRVEGDVAGDYAATLQASSGPCQWDDQTVFRITQAGTAITIEDTDPEKGGTGSFAAVLNDDGTFSGSDGQGGDVTGRIDGSTLSLTASGNGCSGTYTGARA